MILGMKQIYVNQAKNI